MNNLKILKNLMSKFQYQCFVEGYSSEEKNHYTSTAKEIVDNFNKLPKNMDTMPEQYQEDPIAYIRYFHPTESLKVYILDFDITRMTGLALLTENSDRELSMFNLKELLNRGFQIDKMFTPRTISKIR